MTKRPAVLSLLTTLLLSVFATLSVPAIAGAQLQTFTDRAAWEAAIAAAGSSAQFYDFTGLGLVPPPDTTGINRVDQLDTDYAGRFRIVIDQLATSAFSNPGLDIFPDAGCSLGTGDCNVFTFNMIDPTSTLVAPKFNRLIMPTPIVAFGGHFIQTGVAVPGNTVTGPVTLRFGTDTVVVNNFLDSGGNGFFGFVAAVPATTIEFTFAKSGTIQNDIFQVYNPAFGLGPAGPAPAYGVVARAARRGEFGSETDNLGGDVGIGSITRWVASSDGSSAARAVLGTGICTGPAQVTEECMRAGAYAGARQGASRSIAFRSFRYTGTLRSGRVNAVLDGLFREAPFNLPNGFLTVGGSVRLLDASAFSQLLANAGSTAGEFLLGGYTVSEGTDIEERFRQTRIQLSASLLSSGEQFLANNSAPSDTPVTVPVSTGSFIFQPGAIYTIMLDAATSSLAQRFGDATGWGQVDFLSTLAPASVFFTDDAGNPIAEFEALGSVPAPPPGAAVLTLAPDMATSALDSVHTVTATVTDASGNPVPDALVNFSVTGGPNAGVSGLAGADVSGQATFSYTGIGGVGTDVIKGTIGSLESNTSQTTWTPPGVLDHIAITPGSVTIAAGASQAFTVEAFDRFDYSRGEVTASTSFSITPSGTCANASCTPVTSGLHTVTATHQGKTATASLTVTGTQYAFTGFLSPIDNVPVVNAAKAGSSLPIKFSLQGNQGLDILAPGYPTSQQMACVTGVAEDQIEQLATPGMSGLQYDAQTDTYTYVWKTDKSWTGKCRQMVLKLKDGSTHTALFTFK